MKEIYDNIRTAGAEVIAVSFSGPKFVANYVKKYPLPFPAVSDPERRAYQQFSLGKTSWLEMFHPRVIWGYVRLMLKGWSLWKTQKGDDLLQLGGDIILDQDRKVIYHYPSQEPTDRPPVKELIRHVEAVAKK